MSYTTLNMGERSCGTGCNVYAKAGKCDEAREMFQELEELVSDKDVGEEMMLYRKQKIDEMPMMDWLRQLLKERCV